MGGTLVSAAVCLTQYCLPFLYLGGCRIGNEEAGKRTESRRLWSQTTPGRRRAWPCHAAWSSLRSLLSENLTDPVCKLKGNLLKYICHQI